jgi:hypothetical protein
MSKSACRAFHFVGSVEVPDGWLLKRTISNQEVNPNHTPGSDNFDPMPIKLYLPRRVFSRPSSRLSLVHECQEIDSTARDSTAGQRCDQVLVSMTELRKSLTS